MRLKYNFDYNVKALVHGDNVRKKEQNMVYVFFENLDGTYLILDMNTSKESKLAKLKRYSRITKLMWR